MDDQTSGSPEAGSDAASLPPLDLRVARVTVAREHPNADRLLVLRVDLGGAERQVVAGIVGHYEPGELEGMNIVVVVNLRPARLRGEESQGMLLAAEDEEGNLGLLTAPGAEPGTRLSTGDAEVREITFPEFQARRLEAGADGVTAEGQPVEGARLVVDGGVRGRLR